MKNKPQQGMPFNKEQPHQKPSGAVKDQKKNQTCQFVRESH
jgi:hypothetical protein